MYKIFYNLLVQHVAKYIFIYDNKYNEEIETLFETSDEYILKQT